MRNFFRFGNRATNPNVRRGSPERALDIDAAMDLPPGADHYRAFVGPPARYGMISATQFALLFAFGLRETDKVLDIGCGSLRLGRLLIPFLREGGYFGVDPNGWLIEEAIDRELGRDAVRLKRPSFSHNEDFKFDSFGQRFDFIIAQSIATHCGPDLVAGMLAGAQAVIGDDGLFLFTYRNLENEALPADGWHYPGVVHYGADRMDAFVSEAGFASVRLPWFHPGGATWMAAAKNRERLPAAEDMPALAGTVLSRP